MARVKNKKLNIRLPSSIAEQVAAIQKERGIKHFATACTELIKEALKTPESTKKMRKKRQPTQVRPKAQVQETRIVAPTAPETGVA